MRLEVRVFVSFCFAALFAPLPSIGDDSVVDPVTEQLFRTYVVSNGKLSTESVNAAIVLVADRGKADSAFQKELLKALELHGKGDDHLMIRRKLLAVTGRILAHTNHAGFGKSEVMSNAAESATVASNTPARGSYRTELLQAVLRYGRFATRADIDDFVLAIRKAHDPQTESFLLDVLRNSPNGKWIDNVGGQWRDAKFHAAVGLAELGHAAGVDWLIQHAQDNDFGIDGSVSRGQHFAARTGSLRENCRLALRDLAGIRSISGPVDWNGWWIESRQSFSPSPVMLREE